MLLAEAKRLVRDYGAWLNESFDVELEGDYAVISTPFLDPHNDEIELYVRKEGDNLVLTDRGSTLGDLVSSGLQKQTSHQFRTGALKVRALGLPPKYGARNRRQAQSERGRRFVPPKPRFVERRSWLVRLAAWSW